MVYIICSIVATWTTNTNLAMWWHVIRSHSVPYRAMTCDVQWLFTVSLAVAVIHRDSYQDVGWHHPTLILESMLHPHPTWRPRWPFVPTPTLKSTVQYSTVQYNILYFIMKSSDNNNRIYNYSIGETEENQLLENQRRGALSGLCATNSIL